MSLVGTSSGSPGEGTDLLPFLVPGHPSSSSLPGHVFGVPWGWRATASLSLASPKGWWCLLPRDHVWGVEVCPCPSVCPHVGLRAAGIDHSPLCLAIAKPAAF